MRKREERFRSWDILIPIVLFLLFVIITMQGIGWGLPDHWHPDELGSRVLKALAGEWEFDSENFDYPSLPKHIMYLAGKLAYAAGADDAGAYWGMRFVSVLFGGGLVVMAYALTRTLGLNVLFSLLAALLVGTNSQLAQNARFAHNDVYLAFFTALSAWFVLMFVKRRGRLWLYAAAFVIGLTASSKYNGGGIILVPVLLYLVFNRKTLFKDLLRQLETLTFTGMAAAAGYALGTPKALLWPAFYFKRLIPALTRHANYARTPDAVRGFIGEWRILQDVMTSVWFWIAAAAVLWLILSLARRIYQKKIDAIFWIWTSLLLVLITYNLPIMISYNYQPRFFLPMLPLLAVITVWGVDEMQLYLRDKMNGTIVKAVPLLLIPALVLGALQTYGVLLLMANDSREAASDFMADLESKKHSIETTNYGPRIERKAWGRAHNYPLVFISFPDQELSYSPFFVYNSGEKGLDKRETTYLVIDSFTYNRFNNDYVCELHLKDCTFFKKLLAGKGGYEEIASFEFRLPDWIPDFSLAFINPDIKVFKRLAE